MHRGNCSFTVKANVAEAAGASAILIMNNRAGFCFHFSFYCNVLMKSKSFLVGLDMYADFGHNNVYSFSGYRQLACVV